LVFDGGSLWVGQSPAKVGKRVRARVLARDVSVAREAPAATSILNVLPVTLQALQADGGTVLLGLSPGHHVEAHAAPCLLARITLKSCNALQLQPGDALFAQVKAVALM